MFGDVAKELLTVATTAGVDVDRAFVAAGPDFAHDCRLIAVHMTPEEAVPPQPRGPRGAPLNMCAWLTKATFTVTFSDPCVPKIGDDHQPPPPEDVTEHATGFYDDWAIIYDAVGAWIGEQHCCDGDGVPGKQVVIQSTVSGGPARGTVWKRLPLTVTFT